MRWSKLVAVMALSALPLAFSCSDDGDDKGEVTVRTLCEAAIGAGCPFAADVQECLQQFELYQASCPTDVAALVKCANERPKLVVSCKMLPFIVDGCGAETRVATTCALVPGGTGGTDGTGGAAPTGGAAGTAGVGGAGGAGGAGGVGGAGGAGVGGAGGASGAGGAAGDGGAGGG
jgi:hypothetical protein